MTQQEALDILKMGHSVYLTGEAGTGKTYVLNAFAAWLQEHGVEPSITASTGIAATHIEGITIHSWSGIGVREALSDFQLDQMEQKRALQERFANARVLIIDEISMLSGHVLDMCDRVCRYMKRSDRPFGGMQVVLAGDFFQLPPIASNSGKPPYAFESNAWKALKPVTCYLTEQYRQEDAKFYELLSAIRGGRITDAVWEMIVSRQGAVPSGKGMMTRLFTHNVDVDALNEEELAKLQGEEKISVMQSAGKKQDVESLMRGCLAPERLALKKGALVMFVKNDTAGQYVNGTQGIVTGFERGIPVVETVSGRTVRAFRQSWKREDDGKVLAEITQVPLRLAWAITVHKSQGMTLDEAEIDLSRAFVPGQGYVALSRVRSLAGLYLRGLNEMALRIDEHIASADRAFQEHSKRAALRLGQLGREDIQERQHAFLRACGGSVESVALSRKKEKQKERIPTLEQTRRILERGVTLQDAARERNLSLGTIIGHAEKIVKEGASLDLSYLAPSKKIEAAVNKAMPKRGLEYLTPLKRRLEEQGYDLSYDHLRLIRLYLWSRQETESR